VAGYVLNIRGLWNREHWRLAVEEAKAHPGLQRQAVGVGRVAAGNHFQNVLQSVALFIWGSAGSEKYSKKQTVLIEYNDEKSEAVK
jgi:hypothetical protein